MSAFIAERAPAKLNLFLHVVGRRADGYHLLETLFAFTEAGDDLRVEAADGLSLAIEGPYAASLAAEGDNLVLRAARALAAAAGLEVPQARIVLRKNLPVAAGLGGGSADAGAALRALNRLWGLDWPLERLAAIGAELGADIPACVYSRPMVGRDIGTDLSPVQLATPVPVVLVNPGVPLVTVHVFRAFAEIGQEFTPPLGEGAVPPAPTIDWMAGLGNDLEPAAKVCCPLLDGVEDALRQQEGATLVRMAGSGPTWFALFRAADDAGAAALRLQQRHPDWWVVETTVLCG